MKKIIIFSLLAFCAQNPCASESAYSQKEIADAWDSNAVNCMVGSVLLAKLKKYCCKQEADKNREKAVEQEIDKVELTNSLQGDCALVKLLCFYWGEGRIDEIIYVIGTRGKRMIPVLKFALKAPYPCSPQWKNICVDQPLMETWVYQAMDEITAKK